MISTESVQEIPLEPSHTVITHIDMAKINGDDSDGTEDDSSDDSSSSDDDSDDSSSSDDDDEEDEGDGEPDAQSNDAQSNVISRGEKQLITNVSITAPILEEQRHRMNLIASMDDTEMPMGSVMVNTDIVESGDKSDTDDDSDDSEGDDDDDTSSDSDDEDSDHGSDQPSSVDYSTHPKDTFVQMVNIPILSDDMVQNGNHIEFEQKEYEDTSIQKPPLPLVSVVPLMQKELISESMDIKSPGFTQPKIIESVNDYDQDIEDIITPIVEKSSMSNDSVSGQTSLPIDNHFSQENLIEKNGYDVLRSPCVQKPMTKEQLSVPCDDDVMNVREALLSGKELVSADSDEHNTSSESCVQPSSISSSKTSDMSGDDLITPNVSVSAVLDTIQMTPPPSVPSLASPKVSPLKPSHAELSRRNVGHATKTHKIHTSPPQGITALAPPHPTMSTLPIVSAAVPGPSTPVQKCAMVPFTPETLDVRQLGLESPSSQAGYSDCAQQGYKAGTNDSHQSPGMMTSPASSYAVSNHSPASNNTNFTLPKPSPSNNNGFMSNSPNNTPYSIRQPSPSNGSFPMANPSPGANVNTNGNFTIPNPSSGNNYTSMPTPSPTNSHNSYNTGMATPSPTGRTQCGPLIAEGTPQSYNMQQHNVVVQQHMPPQTATPHPCPPPPPLTPVPATHAIHPMCSSAPPSSNVYTPVDAHRLAHNQFDNPCAMPSSRPPGCPGTPMQGYHQHNNSSCSLTKLQQLTNVVGGPVGGHGVMELANENAINTMTPPPQHMSPPPLNSITNEHNIQAAQRNNMTPPAMGQQTSAYKGYNRRSQHKNSNVSLSANMAFTPNVAIQPGTNMLTSYDVLNGYHRMQQPIMGQPSAAGYMNHGFINQAQIPMQMGMMHPQAQQHIQQQMSQQRPQNAMYTYGYAMPAAQHFNGVMRR